MRNERQITFSLSATNVNALDGTAITLATFPNDGIIRVPERLELRREAGTAYTLTKGSQPITPLINQDYDSYAEGFSRSNVLQVYEGTVGSSTPRVWFKVSAEGFLDSAAQQDRIVFPFLQSKEFEHHNVTSLLIEYRGQGITSGTGSLEGTIFFNEYAITQPIGR